MDTFSKQHPCKVIISQNYVNDTRNFANWLSFSYQCLFYYLNFLSCINISKLLIKIRPSDLNANPTGDRLLSNNSFFLLCCPAVSNY